MVAILIAGTILTTSILLQIITAFLALRLIRVTGMHIAWVSIAIALFFMAVRRCISLFRLIFEDVTCQPDPTAELVALATSALLLVGVAWIAPLFLSITRSEEALRASEEKFRAVLNAVPDLMVILDAEGRYRDIFTADPNLLLARADQLYGKTIHEVMPETNAQQIQNVINQTLSTGKLQQTEYVLDIDGVDRWFAGRVAKFTFQNSECVLWSARDITERVWAEDRIKASLKEKEVLLREIHHRVKNNLQVVSSLLDMQARRAGNGDLIDVLTESQNRINAMALIHTQLYESGDLSEINMKEFVDTLLTHLFRSCPVHGARITKTISVADYPVPLSIAVPIGLIVNELLSNILKHAFVGRAEGTIEVSLTASEEGKINLSVSDDGVGLPAGFDIDKTRTLGLRLIKILTEDQLQGTLEVISCGGTTFNIEFDIRYDGGV